MSTLYSEEEYLKREEILGTTYDIGEKLISIKTPNTTYVQCQRVEKVEKENLLRMIKDIKSLAKTKQLKVKGLNKILKSIHNEYDNYELIFTNREQMFENALMLAKEIEKRKIRYGTTDDYKLKLLMNTISMYQDVSYSSSAKSICYRYISGYNYSLERALEFLNREIDLERFDYRRVEEIEFEKMKKKENAA